MPSNAYHYKISLWSEMLASRLNSPNKEALRTLKNGRLRTEALELRIHLQSSQVWKSCFRLFWDGRSQVNNFHWATFLVALAMKWAVGVMNAYWMCTWWGEEVRSRNSHSLKIVLFKHRQAFFWEETVLKMAMDLVDRLIVDTLLRLDEWVLIHLLFCIFSSIFLGACP